MILFGIEKVGTKCILNTLHAHTKMQQLITYKADSRRSNADPRLVPEPLEPGEISLEPPRHELQRASQLEIILHGPPPPAHPVAAPSRRNRALQDDRRKTKGENHHENAQVKPRFPSKWTPRELPPVVVVRSRGFVRRQGRNVWRTGRESGYVVATVVTLEGESITDRVEGGGRRGRGGGGGIVGGGVGGVG